jgi:hypothetical protein
MFVGVASLSSRRISAALAAVYCLLLARTVSGQAFIPAPGEGDVTVTYQNARSKGHLDLNGNLMSGESGHDSTQTHSAAWDIDFGLTRRLAVSASLPFVAARYSGLSPHLVDVNGTPSEIDDGTYHPAFQDFNVRLQFNLKARPIAITPFVEGIIPSHQYPSLAHSAVGKDLRGFVMGAAVGGFVDRLLPGLVFQSQMSYAIFQEVVGIRPNHTRIESELGYFITPRVSVRFLESYQYTYHGLDLISFSPPNVLIHGHPEIAFSRQHFLNHDRLQRINYLNLGGGIGVGLNDSLDIFVSGAKTIWGQNVHPLRGFNVGANIHFRTRRGTP